MKRFLLIAATIFAASIIGWAILLFLVPDRLVPSAPPFTALETVWWALGVALVLPTALLGMLLEPLHPQVPAYVWLLLSNLASALVWSLLIDFFLRRLHTPAPKPTAPSQSLGKGAQR